MEELIELVARKTGLPEATARKAVETVFEFLRERLPDPLGSQLENLLEGGDVGDILGGIDLGDLGGLADNLGGLFGKK